MGDSGGVCELIRFLGDAVLRTFLCNLALKPDDVYPRLKEN